MIKLPAAAAKTNLPVSTAIKAKRTITKLDASLIRLSPSKMETSLFGIFTSFNTEVAATASGGEIMPPSKRPNAKLKPGISITDTKATINALNITSPKPNNDIALRHFQKSFQLVFQAAA